MASRKSLRILCLGDSLTSGYHSWGTDSHPYSRKLEEKLQAAFPQVAINIVTNGQPGDVVTFDRFETRMRNECAKASFDWAIVLGGTNDLAYGISPAKIYASLQKIWSIPLSKGSKVLALTIPECRAKPEAIVKKRDEINLSIMTHQAPNYYFFDLESHIPYHSLSPEERAKYWDDGLHLRPAGYDWMGEHIAEGLIRILKLESAPGPSASTRSTRTPVTKPPEEGVSFDEESGNPRNISEGYVVVRKRDLD